MAIHYVRKGASAGRTVERIELPIARVRKREPEHAAGERPFTEKFRAGVSAVGLGFESVRAPRAVKNIHATRTVWRAADVVRKRPTLAAGRRPAGRNNARVIGARPDEVQAATFHREIDDLLLDFPGPESNRWIVEAIEQIGMVHSTI